jgi:hypothetical protein
LTKVRYQRLLRSLLQSLFDHIDDQHRGSFTFQADEQSDQRPRYLGTLIDEPRQSAIDARLESWLGVESGCGRRAIVFQPLQAQEGRVRQSLGQTLSQTCLAAAQRPDDIVDRPDVA